MSPPQGSTGWELSQSPPGKSCTHEQQHLPLLSLPGAAVLNAEDKTQKDLHVHHGGWQVGQVLGCAAGTGGVCSVRYFGLSFTRVGEAGAEQDK